MDGRRGPGNEDDHPDTVNSISAVSTSPTWVGRPSLAGAARIASISTRTQARNFYYGLKLLPEPKRSAMFALYAYMRLVDDIADQEDGRTIQQRMGDLDALAQSDRRRPGRPRPRRGRHPYRVAGVCRYGPAARHSRRASSMT